MAAGEIKKPGRTRKSPGFRDSSIQGERPPIQEVIAKDRKNIMDPFPPIRKPIEYPHSTRAAAKKYRPLTPH
jgi:hypothetical protein